MLYLVYIFIPHGSPFKPWMICHQVTILNDVNTPGILYSTYEFSSNSCLPLCIRGAHPQGPKAMHKKEQSGGVLQILRR
jgi:hypothetical protein